MAERYKADLNGKKQKHAGGRPKGRGKSVSTFATKYAAARKMQELLPLADGALERILRWKLTTETAGYIIQAVKIVQDRALGRVPVAHKVAFESTGYNITPETLSGLTKDELEFLRRILTKPIEGSNEARDPGDNRRLGEVVGRARPATSIN